MAGQTHTNRNFPDEFNRAIELSAMPGNRAYFGQDVLKGLVDGIDDFLALKEERWQQFRSMGPGLLASAMWLDDADLISRLEKFSGACIVITKQGKNASRLRRMQKLKTVNENTRGLAARAFPGLGGMAPKVAGKPAVVGPYDKIDDWYIPMIRTLGFRKRDDLPPVMHAKLALLGHFWWHDEGALGYVEDVMGFTAQRLWVSSANFTASSRRSLEYGFWTEDRDLIDGAKQFLMSAIRHSEGLDPDADHLSPEFAHVDFDDEAFIEVMSEMRRDGYFDEDEDE